MHKVYVLENTKDKTWYIGQTDDLKRRLHQHNTKTGGRTTAMRENGSWKLIYAEAYIDKRDAVGREKFLKGGSGRAYLKKQMRHYLNNY
ncbi:MAG TPA: GIY-YIG nuclease family protein [Candidatus Paceibacterota bacterium]|nr:GIY-YIG nuclease family protein [Candidatus Paceibacterota bacterium]